MAKTNLQGASANATVKGCSVYVGTDLTTKDTSGTGYAVEYNSENFDVGGWHDNATNNTRLTIPSGVTYAEFGFFQRVSDCAEDLIVTLRADGATNLANTHAHRIDNTGSTLRGGNSFGPFDVSAIGYVELVFSGTDTSVTVKSGAGNTGFWAKEVKFA